MEIKGKKAIVTGAASGLGLNTALMLSELGAAVAAFDINIDELNQKFRDIPNITPVLCNVADPDMAEAEIIKAEEAMGGIDILVNNAGIMKSAPLLNLLNKNDRKHSVELWQNVIDVNLSSVFYMTRTAADIMLNNRTKGVIVNISSISAKGNAGQTAYSASKAGVEAMTKVWAKELGRFKIRCAAVAPGFTDTSGGNDALEETLLAKWVEQTPLRRTGDPGEISSAVRFIIENDFVNGCIINVDGGLVL